jgi:hypothetical protein
LVGIDTEDEITARRAYKALLSEGISKNLARAWVIEYDEAYVFEKLDLARNQAASGRIKSSKAGFLKSAIEDNYHNEDAQKQKRLEVAQTANEQREKLERQLEALKNIQREAEASYRRFCYEMVEEALQTLSEAQRDAAAAEFQLSLGSRIYVNAFKKSGWKDRLNALEMRAFWGTRGLNFPSPTDWAQKNGSTEPDTLRAQIEELELEIKKPVISV